jgi:hypothetical protein
MMTGSTIREGLRAIAWLALVLTTSSIAPVSRADNGIEIRVRRLWVQASDGAVRHRDLVAPSKDSLIAMADSAIPYLLPHLETEDARERHTITDLFKGIGSGAIPHLTRVLGTGNDYHTRNTLWALQKIGDSSATAAMVPFLNDTLWTVRDQAATSIGACGGPDAQAALYSALNDEKRRVRKSAVVGLGRLGRPSASDSLVAAMADDWFGVRYTAATALVALDSGAVASTLCKKLDVEPLALVLRAFAASASDQALAVGMRFTEHEDYRVRAAAAYILSEHLDSQKQFKGFSSWLNSEQHPLVKTYLRTCAAKWSP